MLPLIIAAVGGYLIADSRKSVTKMADGGRFSDYSNDALKDMIINLSRYEDNKEIIDSVKEELERRKLSQKFDDGGYVDDDKVIREMSNFSDRLIYAKRGIYNASGDEDTDLAIEEYYTIRKEKEVYEKKISDIKDKARADRNVENIIEDEKEAAERMGYEYKKLYKKDPRLAALKSAEDLIEFLKSKDGMTPEEAIRVERSINSFERDIADLKRNIKENPILK